ncbi:hypothetical protein [Oricola sp.]|uniref:hypothetical protein n=1 Tax=Oricola sp. TaxID=1979950 RepID=UPI003BAB2529
MLGVGLGGFVQGFEAGVGLRGRIDEQRERRANKKALQAIDDETRQAYDTRVASGQENPDSYEDFWMRYALPKRQAELLRQGDIAGARALEEWSTSSSARQGQKLFASAMTKALTGDPGGGLDDAIQAAQVKGYIEHDYELVSQDELRTEDGKLVGFRIKLKQGDQEVEQDIAINDVPRIISTFANPDLAWQTHRQRIEEEEERAREKDDKREARAAGLADYKEKKRIDREFDDPGYEKAYRTAFETRLENDLEFADLSPEEQDKMVRADLAAQKQYATDQRGAPSATGLGSPPASVTPKKAAQKVLIDTGTRRPVNAPSARQPVERRPLAAPEPDPNVSGLGGPQTTAPAAAERLPAATLEAVETAKKRIVAGDDVHQVRKDLVRQGVDPSLLER